MTSSKLGRGLVSVVATPARLGVREV